jgi:hypothetical protein
LFRHSAPRTKLAGKRSRREGKHAMSGKKKQVKPAPKKDAKKSLQGVKKLGDTKLMVSIFN